MSTADFPDAYLVGAPKAGSSALMNMLIQHPEIQGCGIKEPNYHCRDLDMPGARTTREYLKLCVRQPNKKVLVDGSILNLFSQEAAKSIHSCSPDARILMVLRNPVEAMYSWHSQMVFTGNEPIVDFREALEAESDRRNGLRVPAFGASSRCPELLYYSAVMKYAEQIPRYLALFPRDHIHILLQEDLRRDPANVSSAVFAFLGVSQFKPVAESVNANKVRRSPGLHRTLKQIFAAPARVLLPVRLRWQLIRMLDRWNSVETPRPKMTDQLAQTLAEQVRPDVEQLEILLGRTLNHWLR
ncbi:MAG: sulfotransferase [Fuerstiella sp.]